LDVKHGDIKSNNVKFNTQTSNYLLLDFGLAIMSDEQRRSSLRQAGAIEFMAPEQNTGQMLFETDVYSFGVVIFELLAGVVPFPLNGKGESARNEVRLAHMVTPVPEVLQLRQQALPSHWNDKKKEYEMQVPDWLISMVYKCLEKKPTGRFASGSELHEYLSGNYTNASKSKQGTYKLAQLEQENKDLSNKNEQFQKQEFLYQKELTSKQEEIQQLKAAVSERDRQSVQGKEVPAKGINGSSGRKVVSRNWFVALMVLVIGLSCCVGFLVYHDKGFFADSSTGSIEKRTSNEQRSRSENPNRQPEDDSKKQTAPVDQQQKLPEKTSKNKSLPSSGNGQGGEQKDIRKKGSIPDTGTIDGNTEIEKTGDETITERKEDPVQPSVSSQPIEEPKENDTRRSNRVLKKYLVTSKAWFHNGPNGESKQNLYIGPEEKAVVEAIEERYGFIYVVVKNPQGRAFKGWLRKSDLNLYSIE
jgi:serine/threonine-protein kinase